MTAAVLGFPRVETGFADRDGERHAWYALPGSGRRWLSDDAPVEPEILKGNADLVGSGVWERDFEARR